MNRNLLAALSTTLIALCLVSCKNKPENTPQPAQNATETATVVAVKFVPPSDSAISAPQMNFWQGCNPLLDSLTYLYSDSFKTQDPTARLRYQEDFSAAQDKICVRAGLPGGYAEYRWILENMGNPRNKELLDAISAQVIK